MSEQTLTKQPLWFWFGTEPVLDRLDFHWQNGEGLVGEKAMKAALNKDGCILFQINKPGRVQVTE